MKNFTAVHDRAGKCVALVKWYEQAACLVAMEGPGATIQHHGKVVWEEGSESRSACAGWDHVAGVVSTRIYDLIAEAEEKKFMKDKSLSKFDDNN